METEPVIEENGTKPVYELEEVKMKKTVGTDINYRHTIIWYYLVAHIVIQAGFVYGWYRIFFHAKLVTFAWAYFVGYLASQGVSLAAHRLYSHKSYKPTDLLQAILIVLQCMSGQNSILRWVKDHRLHHKYSDTDADPHNATRGLFYSHMGWLMVKRHPQYIEKARQLDISDLKSNKFVMFQYRNYIPIYLVFGVLFPISVPMIFWNETFHNSLFVAYFAQYGTVLHITWIVNSLGHTLGYKTYDRRIRAADSAIAWMLTAGEGWHNFHHAFPWDARFSEVGQFGGTSTNTLKMLIKLGLASDMKTASEEVIYGHMKRHGDDYGKKHYQIKFPENVNHPSFNLIELFHKNFRHYM